MLRMIIVDDKEIVLEGLQRLIDWQKYGVQIIGTCTNGMDAYDMILGEYPDIVFTDIKMPSMDGLELIQRSQEIDKNIKFVILSGYAEFDFAKKAMECGVRHYLLKPYNEEQIIEVVKSITNEIAIQKEKDDFMLSKKLMSEEYEQSFTRQLFVDLITTEKSAEDTIDLYKQMFGNVEQEYYLCAFSPVKESHLDYIIDSYTAVMDCKTTSEKPYFIYFPNLLVTFLTKKQAESIENKKHILIKDILENFPGTEAVNISGNGYGSVPDMIEDFRTQLHQFDWIMFIDEKKGKHSINLSVSEKQNLAFRLASVNSNTDPETLSILISEIFSTAFNVDIARTLAMKILVKISKNEQTHQLENAVKEIFAISSVSAVQEAALYYSKKLLDEHMDFSNFKEYVKEAIGYINDNIENPNISLKWIAEEKLFLNVDYFSHQFALQTGEKFSSYLNKIRMNKAKQLIAQAKTENIYEVAAQVGCGHNPRYFSQVFKKWVGCTPSQYRESLRNKTAI